MVGQLKGITIRSKINKFEFVTQAVASVRASLPPQNKEEMKNT